MSKIKNDGLDQYGVGSFERQKFGTAGVEGVNVRVCRSHGHNEFVVNKDSLSIAALSRSVQMSQL